jgi:hypothetical protein
VFSTVRNILLLTGLKPFVQARSDGAGSGNRTPATPVARQIPTILSPTGVASVGLVWAAVLLNQPALPNYSLPGLCIRPIRYALGIDPLHYTRSHITPFN